MKTKVTIKDIAREAGVSTALVSFVMTNLRGGKTAYRVNKETTAHILRVAKELDYQPNITARNLKYGKSGTIGVIFSDISNPFSPRLQDILKMSLGSADVQSCSEVRMRVRKSLVSLLTCS